MASMDNAQDRARVLDRMNDELAALESRHSPQPIDEVEPVSQAWLALRETVRQELRAAKQEAAA